MIDNKDSALAFLKDLQKSNEEIKIHICMLGGDTTLVDNYMKALEFAVSALETTLIPGCWETYYPDTEEEDYRKHSSSNKACAKRIAGELGGYIIPIYTGFSEREEG